MYVTKTTCQFMEYKPTMKIKKESNLSQVLFYVSKFNVIGRKNRTIFEFLKEKRISICQTVHVKKLDL